MHKYATGGGREDVADGQFTVFVPAQMSGIHLRFTRFSGFFVGSGPIRDSIALTISSNRRAVDGSILKLCMSA
jgi:hypothetical protein